MRSTTFAPAFAGLIGAAQALIPGLTSDLAPAEFDLGMSWDNEVLFNGVCGVATSTDAAIDLGLNIREAQIEGLIALESLEDFLKEPTLRLDLAGIKAYFAIDISASAAVYETVQLVASPELEIDAGLLELGLGAAFALDLVVGVGAAVDLSAGFYVSFAAGDYIDLSVITKEIVGSKLDGLVAKALPIGVGANVDLSAQIEIQLGLRLRSHIYLDAGIDLLGLDLLDAGAEVAIWVDLLQHTMTLVETAECVVALDNQFVLQAGIAVEVGLELLDLLDISLAPEVNVKLASTLKDKLCLNGRGELGDFLLPKEDSEDSEDSDNEGSEGSEGSDGSVGAPITSDGLVTSTLTTTKAYTITSCHASVINCPASQTQVIVTSVVESTVTVCPVDETPTPAPTSASTTKPVHTITETLTTVVPCEPTSSTYSPPPSSVQPPAPTVTITGSTTVCPTGEPTKTPEPTEVPSVSVPESTAVESTIPAEEPTKPVEEPTKPVEEPTAPVEPSKPVETPVEPSAPVETPAEPTKPAEPSVPVEEPTTPTSVITVPTTGTPAPIPTTYYPPINSTWTTSVPTVPGTSWVPPPPEPTGPPTGGAGALKVGFAMAMPVVAALLL